jgi:hypothetical protein
MDLEFKTFALTLCGFLLAVLSYFLPWYYFVIIKLFDYTPIGYLWFLHQSTISWLFPQGPFICGIFGISATVSLTYFWWKKNIHLSPSLGMLNILILPWIATPSFYFILGFRPSITTGYSSVLIGQGDSFGFIINILAVILLGCAIVCAILDEGIQKIKNTWNRVEIIATLSLITCASLLVVSGILPWDPYPRAFAILPITIGGSLLIAAFLTRILGINTGLIIALIWTGLELIWVAGLLIHWLVPVWSVSNSGILFFSLSSIPNHDTIGLGLILLFNVGFLILGAVCFLMWLATIHKYKTGDIGTNKT